MNYSYIHEKVRKEWGKADHCELCGKTDKKRYCWSNKTHTYKFRRSSWWQLCTGCHRKYDLKRFNITVWNKGIKKDRTRMCPYCKKTFSANRKAQVYCGVSCSNKVNGNKPKKLYLKKEGLL
ncbi:MAG: hypothetical protein ACTSQE_07265 [Candidatus Heimdallarchaeaceae archaeon]